MALKTNFLLSLLFSASAVAKTAGYFEDTSICADPRGLSKCIANQEDTFSSCVNNNCAGGSEQCYKTCGGNTACMEQACPNLGIDCINACTCVKAANDVDCIASSCWNQVYSCEYQRTVEDILNYCAKVDMDQLPFWPPPDDAKAGCSCNMGKMDKKQQLISAQLTPCTNNMTNLNQLSDVDDITDYSQACICCAESAIVASIYDTCPNTKPADLGFDSWYDAFLEPNDWDTCGKYLEAYDCAGALGYGAESAGDTQNFYEADNIPKNGTQTLYNTGALSTPVSGATFSWTFGTVVHTVKAVSTDNVVTATATSDSTATGTKTQSGASSTNTNGAASKGVSLTAISFIGLIAFMIC